jgi:hypothetical protein
MKISKRQLDRALQKSFGLAYKQVLRILRHTPNDRVYLEALRRLLKRERLPANNVALPLIVEFMILNTRLPRLKDSSRIMSAKELEEVEDRLYIASFWVENWSKKLKSILIRFLGKDGIDQMMWAYYDVSDKTKGGHVFGDLLEGYAQ